jgi:hypothetical protein
MRAMNSNQIILGTVLGLILLAPAQGVFADTKQAAVADSFDWAGGIIDGLATLEPEPVIQATVTPEPEQVPSRRGHRHHDAAPVPTPRPAAVVFAGRRFTLQKNTVFGVFSVTVVETSPTSFDLAIVSDDPAENIEVKDSVTDKVCATRPLDDETSFTIHVPEHLSPAIAVSVSVIQDGDINKAYFPLLGSDRTN